MKLFTRYNRINLALTVILLVLSALVYYFVINRVLVHELDEQLDEYRQKIEGYAARTGSFPELGVLEDLQVTYEPGRSLTPTRYQMIDQYDPEEKRKEPFRQLIYSQQAGGRIYKVTIAKPLEGVHLLSRTMMYITVLILLIIIIVSLLINHFVLKELWRPFYASINIIKGFRLPGKNPPQFPATRTDEFRLMNENLDRMVKNAQTDYLSLKEFTENASHEIQTPLAIIRSKLDLVIQEESLTEKQGRILDGAYAAIKRISRLNQSLLLLTKIENSQFSGSDHIDVNKELSEKMDQFKELWQDNAINIQYSSATSYINANRELIDILLNNLLANATIHNGEGGIIIIDLKPGELVISNSGIQRALDQSRLFRRFYKGEQNSQHNGLGLSIAKQICDQSGIRISYTFAMNLHSFALTWKNAAPTTGNY